MTNKFANLPWVYIASPYTKGDQALNTRFQMLVFDQLLTDGVVLPYAPLVSHFQHLVSPRRYQDWIDYDLALMSRFDICLRLSAEFKDLGYFQKESSGADGEVNLFKSLYKPVVYSLEELYDLVMLSQKRTI
jgi:hypothetical protein